jgi:hypothetical protein
VRVLFTHLIFGVK